MAALLLLPHAGAQVPPVAPPSGEPPIYAFQADVDRGYSNVSYLGLTRFTITLQDMSRDDQAATVAPYNRVYHQVRPLGAVVEGSPSGWGASIDGAGWGIVGGQTITTTLTVMAGAAIREPIVRVNASFEFVAGNTVIVDDVSVVVQVSPYYYHTILIRGAPPPQEQEKIVTIPVELGNPSLYPNIILLNATGPPGWKVQIPPQVTLQPFETRVVNLTVHTPFFQLYEPGVISGISVNAASIYDPDVVYTRTAIVKVQGFYVKSQWIPLLSFIPVALALLVMKTAGESKRREKERGGPRPPEIPPKQQVLLMELKRRDPEAYNARMAQLAALYRARTSTYKQERKVREREERALIVQERAEAREEAMRRRELQKKAAEVERLRKEKAREIEAARAKKLAEIDAIRREADKYEAARAKKQAGIDERKAKTLEKLRDRRMKQLEAARKKAAKEAKRAAKSGAKARDEADESR